jgi:putative SOS response-associated peptidase YedK
LIKEQAKNWKPAPSLQQKKANEILKPIHDIMPVILKAENDDR